MARARRRRGAKRARRGAISFTVSPQIQRAIDTARRQGRRVVIVGEVRGGRIQMSSQGLAAATSIARRRPRAQVAFVALNAPFKTKASTALG